MRKVLPALLAGAVLSFAAPAVAAEFTVKSIDAQNGRLPQDNFSNNMGCTGGNLSPEISWSGAPEDAKSFVLTIFDQDAPSGSGWWHWVVVNIPASVNMLPQGASNTPERMPEGAIQTNTDVGQPGYIGPCPPPGQTHRYQVTVIALKVDKLDLPPNATAAMVGLLANRNRLAKASLSFIAGR